VIALGVLAAVLYALSGNAEFWTHATLWQRMWRLFLVIAAGGAAYFGTLFLLGFRFADFNRKEAH
jgi:putative peptidoglycan lipid II flippase